jgi:hypothetical protein
MRSRLPFPPTTAAVRSRATCRSLSCVGVTTPPTSYYDGLHFADTKDREQPLPPTAVVGFKSAGAAKDRSLAANIDADRALISFKQMPITHVEANHNALKIARGEIGGLAVEATTLINDFEGRQNPVLLDVVEFDGFIWDPDRNRGH